MKIKQSMTDSPLALIHQIAPGEPTLPAYARLPVNRCNYPAIILGSLTFQQFPEAVYIDNIATFHQPLFKQLAEIKTSQERSYFFEEYMQASFLLKAPEEAGYQANNSKKQRHKADYKRLLRGWFFDSDSREGAVLKGWVESRFGLLTRNHKGPMRDFNSATYVNYTHERSQGLYNTHALESQLDLLYSYCQYELARLYPGRTHFSLYRGTNRLNEYDTLFKDSDNNSAVILNNLTSFSSDLEQCDGFGDTLIETQVPLSKVLFFPNLLPNGFKSENEYIVLGGLYLVNKVPG